MQPGGTAFLHSSHDRATTALLQPGFVLPKRWSDRAVDCFDVESMNFEGHFVGVKRDMAFDFLDRRIRLFVGPDSVFSDLAIGVEAEITGVALIRAMGSMLGSRVMFNRNIRTWDVYNRRV